MSSIIIPLVILLIDRIFPQNHELFGLELLGFLFAHFCDKACRHRRRLIGIK